MALDPGARLGPYEIEKLIGAGGMGEVYKARDTRLGRIVALKVIAPDALKDPRFLQRFDREGKLLSTLNHRHICTLHDVGEHDGARYVVMEYLDGVTLAEWIVTARRPSPPKRARTTWLLKHRSHAKAP
jgi:serine/threonine protein kinase